MPSLYYNYTKTIPSLYHHYTITIPSLYHHYTITLPSLYYHYTITIPSLYHPFTITIQSLFNDYTITMPSLYHHYTITIPSLYHQYTIIIPSLCHNYYLIKTKPKPPDHHTHCLHGSPSSWGKAQGIWQLTCCWHTMHLNLAFVRVLESGKHIKEIGIILRFHLFKPHQLQNQNLMIELSRTDES